MLRKFVVALLVIFGYLLQSTVFQKLSLGGIAPNILLIVTASFGFMRGKKEGMVIGFFSGLIIDVLFGEIIGFYALIYMIIGYCNGFFRSIFYPEDIKLPMVLISSSELVFCFLVYVCRLIFRGRMNFGYCFLHIILPEIVYTIFVTIIIYKVILFINERLEDYEKRRA